MHVNKSSWCPIEESSIYNCLMSYVLLQVELLKLACLSTYFCFLLLKTKTSKWKTVVVKWKPEQLFGSRGFTSKCRFVYSVRSRACLKHEMTKWQNSEMTKWWNSEMTKWQNGTKDKSQSYNIILFHWNLHLLLNLFCRLIPTNKRNVYNHKFAITDLWVIWNPVSLC